MTGLNSPRRPLQGSSWPLVLCAWAAVCGNGCNRINPQNVASEPDRPAAESGDTESGPPPAVPATTAAFDTSTGDTGALPAASGDAPPPAVSDPASVRLQQQRSDLASRPFITLQPRDTQDPVELLTHLREIDSALRDLLLAGGGNIVDQDSFTASGIRLGQMKLEAGRRLAAAADATPDQRKSGQLAQLIALSHLSGLKDVEAARQLEELATEFARSEDADLAHQAQIVRMGFELQALENGVKSDPAELVARASELFQRPSDRNFPELMLLQRSASVLQQLGFNAEAQQVIDILVAEYSTADNPQMRGEAWIMQVAASQAFANYSTALRGLGTAQFDAGAAIAAARGLYEAYPSMQTIEQLAGDVERLEYGGQVALARDLAVLLNQCLASLPQERPWPTITAILDAAGKRSALLNSRFPLDDEIIQVDGSPFDLDRYAGKLVLVDFWATWCEPCRIELANVRNIYTEFTDRGFDVISINMDEKPGAVEQFLASQALPWKTYVSADPARPGFQSSFATQLGIKMIPHTLLLDGDGQVIAMHVRGQHLADEVRRRLGDTESLIPNTDL